MNIYAQDVGCVLDFTINKTDGSPYNLTGATVDLLAGSLAAKPCTIISAAAGTCRLTTTAAEFGLTSTTHSTRLRVNAAGGVILHSSAFQIVVVT